MLILRIDDVGRPLATPSHEGVDKGLEYFKRWRAAAGLDSLPVTYGTIPARLTLAELEACLDTIRGSETVALHGWDHAKGAVVSREDMARGRGVLREFNHDREIESYVPPFNEYTQETIEAWMLAGGRYFFGGRHGHDHHFGHMPKRFGPVTHVPAYEPLYGRSPQLLERENLVRRLGASPAPVVATLHTVWDDRAFMELGELVSVMRPYLCSPTCVDRWFEDIDRSRSLFAASGAQRLPIDYLATLVTPGDTMLDFGARDGEWPYYAALHGATVSVCDRDPIVQAQATRFAYRHPGDLGSVVVSDQLDWLEEGRFDLVTAMWSVQHNLSFESQRSIVERLAWALKPGGRLVLVGSMAEGETYLWKDRTDPMLRLNLYDWTRLLSHLHQCSSPTWQTFRYEHADPRAYIDVPDRCNAVIIEVKKGQ